MLRLTKKSSFAVVSLVFLHLFSGAYAMTCNYKIGPTTTSISCPMMFNDDSKIFCCEQQDTIPHCCDLGEFISVNSAVIGGAIVGVIVLLIIIITCCCCCCSCCWCARRRQQHGTILYAPMAITPVHLPHQHHHGSQPAYPMAYPPGASASPPAYTDDINGKLNNKY